MSEGSRTCLGLVVAFLSLACNLPSCSLAQPKAPAMVHGARADSAHPTSTLDQAFAGLDKIASPKDITPLAVATGPTRTMAPPSFTPDLNAYCRSGPGTTHSQVSLAMKGQPYPIHGRDPVATWYLILVSPSAECWVYSATGSTSGDTSGVRVVQPTGTPDSGPESPLVNCGQYTTRQSCAQHAECKWISSMAAGSCQAK
jgi:hypothetical protein